VIAAAPALALALILGPLAAGVAVTLAAAAGHLPALGATGPSLAPMRAVLAAPGLGLGVALTLWVGFASTALALAIAWAAVPVLWGRRVQALLAPLIGAPHAALALGVAFLLAPSGWIARLLSPWATGWTVPPDLATVGDPMGLALIAGLVVKEAPFLAFVMLAALGQRPVARDLAAARALGYGLRAAWWRAVLPQALPAMRLPVVIVLSYSLSVVDVALILGPTLPPTLPVQVARLFAAPDARMILPGAAAAMLHAAVVAAALGAWLMAGRWVAAVWRGEIARGRRRRGAPRGLAALPVAVLAGGAFAVLALWSVTWRWPFPDPLPAALSLRPWGMATGLSAAVWNTAMIGAASAALALVLAVLWLEAGRARRAEAVLLVPLVVPQTAFVFGLSVAGLRAGVDGGIAAVVWAHGLFVFPYVLLVLAGPWRAFDAGLLRTAAALGAGPVRRLVAVRLPVMLRPLAVALAVGFAVSAGQYLPTLAVGGGRVPTLTTEAVALAAGGDRRIAAVFGLVTAALPVAVYLAALALPRAVWRNRRALR
jgi:putative thiamine transport system permease protein